MPKRAAAVAATTDTRTSSAATSLEGALRPGADARVVLVAAPSRGSVVRSLRRANLVGVLTEDQVVNAVMAKIEAHGWTVTSYAHAHQHGDDIIATRNRLTMRVEAKGAGSSRVGTRRYGQAFNRGQVGSHVAVAVTRALAWVPNPDTRAALAFPDNPDHRERLARVLPALNMLGIGIFWVGADDAHVNLEAPWPLTA